MSQAETPTLRPGDDPTPFLSHPDALYEVVDGQVVEQPSMGIHAALVATELAFALRLFLGQHRLGRVVNEGVFILDQERDLRRRPDVAFVSYERWPAARAIPREGDWIVIPDLAIEVISPRDTYAEVLGKIREYFQYGVRQVWAIEPLNETIQVYCSPTEAHTLDCDDELDGGDLLPGFRLPIGPLFRETME